MLEFSELYTTLRETYTLDKGQEILEELYLPFKYSSVLNRRVGRNKRAGGKIGCADQNEAVQGEFFLKTFKRTGPITINVQDGINMQGDFFSQNQ